MAQVYFADKQACASCQLASLLINARNVSICSSLPGCQFAWEKCEVVRNLPTFGFENMKNDHLDWSADMVLQTQQNCERDGTINFAAIEPTTNGKCMECILVYDLLKYFHDSVIDALTEQAVISAVTKTCFGPAGIILINFCLDARQIIHAVFNGLRDSMESLYELIGYNLLGCPALSEFLCSCLGQTCP
ncbi:unnamed protein product [Toxocara canis]|uniref:Saposin B-type domain-containing protein n=1 Tax=Toxocara canis TaxID=6265 RepID=A0A183TUZ5_TOXCA|nr:unnamed protein product [Toxocara canis]